MNKISKIKYADLKEGMFLGDHINGSKIMFIKEIKKKQDSFGGLIRTGLFKCECGKEFEYNINKAIRGHILSCGCTSLNRGTVNTGDKFGHLTAIKEVEPLFNRTLHSNGKYYNTKITRWLCKCDCGNEVIVRSMLLKNGSQSTCGKCYQPYIPDSYKPELYQRCVALGRIYDKMKSRCNNPDSDKNFVHYGLHNIKLVISLKDFILRFYKDFEGFQPGLTVDRIDNNDGYRDGNIRFVTSKEQSTNTVITANISKDDMHLRLLPRSSFNRLCENNHLNPDEFKHIEFPLHSSGTSKFELHIHKTFKHKALSIVWYYIDLAQSISDKMPTNTNRRYLTIYDKRNNQPVLERRGCWNDYYEIRLYRPSKSNER